MSLSRIYTSAFLILAMSIYLVGCGNKSIDTSIENVSNTNQGKYELTVKLTSNGVSKYIKVDGEGTSLSVPYNEKFTVSYKEGEGAEYSELTDFYRYSTDTYVNIQSILPKLMEMPELEDYVYQIDELDKSYVLINDDTAMKAFDTYLENNPNLLNKVKPRIITEKETAYGITDVASLRTQAKMTADKEELERLSEMTTFVPNNGKSCMMDAYNFLYGNLNNYETAVRESKFGVQTIKLNGTDALNYIDNLRNDATEGVLLDNLFGRLRDSEFIGYLLEGHGEAVNNSFGQFLDAVANSSNAEAAIVQFSVAENGLGKEKSDRVYIKISSDGVNGIEVLYDLKPEVKVESIQVPLDVYNIYNIYENMAVKYLEK